MRRIIIATHGELAKTLVETVELIIGQGHNIDYFCMTKSKSGETGKKELEELIFKENEKELVVFTDVFGGSVNNICSEILLGQPEDKKFHLVSGVNLPMILTTALSGPSNSMKEVLNESIQEAHNGIKYINDLFKGVVE
ncbi:PTS sugar transporter subunit IIA [Terrilactibacillus laevilacticus]|uniref:PTS sugar transporter subunit IIA n=1 Tax=Terrilactibacillus laevilacticus TaxID=1380157 RepID=A0ABW5PNX3_9BACI|nr:PTS mannose transporter subunit IIA [Terrilactibacillus laevilacticus]